ncbi:MAG: PDZ domain-containing protein, partial [Terriglobia bacterium]
VKTVAADLIRDGKVSRGYIGVQIGAVDQTMASALGLDKVQGVLVQGLVKGGSGEAAGLKESDVIISIDAKETNAPNELQSYVATRHPGDVVVLKIFRDGKTMEKRVTLKAREEDNTTVKASNRNNEDEVEPEAPKLVKFENLGLSVRPLTSDEKKSAEVDKGVLVADVKQFSEAFNRDVRANDIILEVDRKEVQSPSDLKKTIDSHKAGDSILLRIKRGNGTNYYAAVQIPKE